MNAHKTAYLEWRTPLNLNELRTDLLQVDWSQKDAWRIMNVDAEHNNVLTLYGGRGQKVLTLLTEPTLELSSAWCWENIYTLNGPNAGSHGPPSSDRGTPTINNHGAFLLAVHDVMCSRYCLALDALRAYPQNIELPIKIIAINCQLNLMEGFKKRQLIAVTPTIIW